MLRIPASLIEELIRIEGEEVILTSHIYEQVQSIKTENQTIQDKYILLQQIGGKLEELINVKDMSATAELQQHSTDFDAMEMDQYSELHTNTHQLIEAAADIYEMGNSQAFSSSTLIRIGNCADKMAPYSCVFPCSDI